MQTPPIKEMVAQVIGTPSVSSTLPQFDMSNQPMVDLLANYLSPLGFEVDIQPIPGKTNKANLVATLGAGTGGLVLAGHTDTVPFDEALWQSNPFELTERDNRWYGLGSCDMKSFLAFCITAASQFDPKTLKHPLTILGTADEESCMSGARALTLESLGHPSFALIGEPTNLTPINRHKGIMMLGLRITGSSGHSSNPALGNNALDATSFVLDSLMKFRADLARRFQDTHFEVDVPTLNLGCIHGGDNPNRICDHVDLSFDLRMLPGMNSEAIVAEIHAQLAPTLEARGLGFDLSLLHPPVPPFESSGANLVNACATESGRQPEAVAFATEAPFLSELGIETVVMGPGSIDQAHQPDEYLPLDHIEPTVDIIRALIHKYCC